ncbi:MAG: type IX secretion system membrane protein PorP/SprF [Chitinophagales bacterium]|nr:type IX secretion system membrane protein PorP/SprF [Chitinophagales bacterium]MDW8393833.1 type IX secretion system membrane protein PorP/SprF [Chitinophagales bacterium]
MPALQGFASRWLILLGVAQVAVVLATAQQLPPLTQLAHHRYAANPAFGGIGAYLHLTAHARAQWVGMPGHPLSQYLSAHAPLTLLNGGAGILLHNELSGALRLTAASLSYSYQRRLGATVVAAGLSAELVQAGLQGNKLRAPEGNYLGGIDHNDPVLPSAGAGDLAADLTAGMCLVHPRWVVGLSAAHLLQSQLALEGSSQTALYRNTRQYVGQFGVTVPLSRQMMLEPVAQVLYSKTALQAEAGASLIYRNQFWAGAGLRGYNSTTADAFMAWLGLQLNPRLRMGYSYDYPRSAVRTVSQGSHELFLSYRLQLLRPPLPGKTIYNTRF